ncbi:unnamed protein product, partial [Arabidopsis halleri]
MHAVAHVLQLPAQSPSSLRSMPSPDFSSSVFCNLWNCTGPLPMPIGFSNII